MAVDLALVQEVLTLGPVTPVPGAPGGVVGAVAVRGKVLPLLDPRALLDPPAPTRTPARQGDAALRLLVPPHELLLLVSQAQEVVDQVDERACTLLDLPRLVSEVADAVAEAANHFQVHPFQMAVTPGPGGEER